MVTLSLALAKKGYSIGHTVPSPGKKKFTLVVTLSRAQAKKGYSSGHTVLSPGKKKVT